MCAFMTIPFFFLINSIPIPMIKVYRAQFLDFCRKQINLIPKQYISMELKNASINKQKNTSGKTKQSTYSSVAPMQHDVRFSDCFLVRSTVSLMRGSVRSALDSSLSHCCTAILKASWTLLAFFAEVSILEVMEFSLHQVSISSCETSRSSDGTSDCGINSQSEGVARLNFQIPFLGLMFHEILQKKYH